MKCYNQEKFNERLDWLQFALSRLFFINYSTNQDRGETLRVVQNSYIALENFEQSIKVFDFMEEKDKRSTLTQYNQPSYISLRKEKVTLNCISKIIAQDLPLEIMTAAAACTIEAKSKISDGAILNIMLNLLTTLIVSCCYQPA